MRGFGRIVVPALVVMTLVSCDFISGLLGPSPNDIISWVRNIEEGTKYTMQERYWIDGQADGTYTYTVEVVDVEERDTRTIIRLTFDQGTQYLIADDTRGELIGSDDDIIDDSDSRILTTPIEDGTSWICSFSSCVLLVYVPEVSLSIASTDGTRDAGTFTATDVVTVRPSLSEKFSETTFTTAETYYSPTYGWLGDRYVFAENGYNYVWETIVTDIDLP